MTSVFFNPRPDWLLFGFQNGDGTVTIIASRELDEAELEHQLEPYPDFGFSRRLWEMDRQYYRISARMFQFVLITAATYQEAFSKLFQDWKPEPVRRPELESRRAIEGGSA
jgi:hypothetical protein